MLTSKKIFTLLIFTFALFVAGNVSAQDSCRFTTKNLFPVVVSAPRPPYPTKAIVEKAEGDVQVDVSIDTTGKVTQAIFVSGNDLLKNAAMASARSWKFNKTEIEDSVRSVRLTFTFYLNPGDYKEQDKDEITYKYHLKIFRDYVSGDCFNDCGKQIHKSTFLKNPPSTSPY